MSIPEFSEAKKLAETGRYDIIPVSCELYSDFITPLEVLLKLKNVNQQCFLLESVENSKTWGRYTFLGFDPVMEITCVNGIVKTRSATSISQKKRAPKEVIREILKNNRSPHLEYLPPFTGGFVGYFAYDSIKYAEPTLIMNAKNDKEFEDLDLMLFDKVIAFDNFRQKIVLIVHVRCKEIKKEYERAEKELKKLKELILHGTPCENPSGYMTSPVKALFSKDAYCDMVKQAKQYIYDGDIFQVVLSNRLEVDFEGELLDTYRVLRTINPSPYMFYLSSGEIEIAGASPETLVKLEKDVLYTFPLAGTSSRGKTEEEDEDFAAKLLSDEKECAEHNMLVDLGRNDIGKISRFGSVEVEKYMGIERFSHVMHIGSAVKGMISPEKDALDAIEAILPAGTLSGAPKIRACQIIDELEQNKRGVYGGGIGYIGFSGNLDTCIAIRFAYRKNGKVFVRSGAGIVADSVPEKEYQECINKAKAMVKALKIAQGGMTE